MGAAENKALSQKMYNSQLKGDLQGFMSCLSEDCVITAPGSDDLLPWRVQVKGRANIPEWLMFMGKHITMDVVKPKQYIADEDKVVVFVHETLTVVKNKKTFELDEIHVHTHKDGKIVDIAMHEDTVAVLAAVRGKEIKDM
jgi:ketosteroid isomerase-like protein